MEIQFATIIRGGNDKPQVVVRIHNPGEVDTAASVLAEAAGKLPHLMQGLVAAVETAPPGAVALIQQELGGQVVGEYVNPGVSHVQAVQQIQQQPGYQQPQPANAHQMAQTANYGQPAPQWAGQPQAQGYVQQPQAAASPCFWCDKDTKCKDCGGPTMLMSKDIRGRRLNLHECTTGQRHKGVWCQTPIWKSKQIEARQQGIVLPAGLVYEQ